MCTASIASEHTGRRARHGAAGARARPRDRRAFRGGGHGGRHRGLHRRRRHGGASSQTVIGYIAWLFLCQGPVLPLPAFARRSRPLFARLKPACGTGPTGGVISLTACGLAIRAQAHGDLATIAALRETSILIAALIATLLFRERFGRLRLTAGAAALAGIVVLELAHP